MIGTPLGAPVPQQIGTMTFPQQATTLPMQAGTVSALQTNGLDINAIMNMMIMLIVVVMMMKMMTKVTKEV